MREPSAIPPARPTAVAPAASAGARTLRAVDATAPPASLTLAPALDAALPLREADCPDLVLVAAMTLSGG
jgi:hypothetical protein